VTLEVLQSPDHLLTVGQTALFEGDPYIVESVEPRPRCSWFPGWLNNAQQIVLHPVEVLVVLRRFDGYGS